MVHLIKSPNLDIDLSSGYHSKKVDQGGAAYPLQHDYVENYTFINDVFTDLDIQKIIKIGEEVELSKGLIGSSYDSSIRNCFVNFLYPNHITSWIFEKLRSAIVQANNSHFNFHLSSLEEGLQFTRYEAPSQHYTWHVDRGKGMSVRKLSLSVQLSGPEEYEGGDLELSFGEHPVVAPKQKGIVALFPSYVVHRVAPVTKGTRYSLVCWVSGPPFR